MWHSDVTIAILVNWQCLFFHDKHYKLGTHSAHFQTRTHARTHARTHTHTHTHTQNRFLALLDSVQDYQG